MRFQTIGILALAGFMSSCASLIEGTDQVVNFSISPKTGTCEIKQKGKALGILKDGGGSIRVSKSFTALTADCIAPGMVRESFKFDSSPSSWGIAGCFLDLCITDHTTGAFNKYQEEVSIKLRNINLGLPAVKPKLVEKAFKRHKELVMPASNRGSGPHATSHLVSSHNSLSKAPRVWKTVHSRVRAYWGPNPQSDFFEMPEHVSLTRIRWQQHWGLFEYVARNGKLGTVWIALNEVEKTVSR